MLATLINIQVMVKIKICQFSRSRAVAISTKLGAKIYGAELDVKIHGANCFGAETYKLGTNCHGVENMVYFLKGYC